MKTPPAFQFYPQDFLVGCADMTPDEVGGYIRLLCYQWVKGGIPNDMRKIKQLTGIFEDKDLVSVLEKFVLYDDDLYRNARLEETRSNQKAFNKKQSGNAINRWHEDQPSYPVTAKQTRSERLSKARELGRHSADDWKLLINYLGGVCVKCGSSHMIVKDHIKPIYLGGSDGIDNLQPLCNTCNSSKGRDCTDHRPSDWVKAFASCPERLPNACFSSSTSSSTSIITTTTSSKKELVAENLAKRKKLFASTLEPFLEIYGRELLNEFYAYWTEENKSGTKFKKEMQSTWSVDRRLSTWAKNDKNFNNGNSKNRTGTTASDRLDDAKRNMAEQLTAAFGKQTGSEQGIPNNDFTGHSESNANTG